MKRRKQKQNNDMTVNVSPDEVSELADEVKMSAAPEAEKPKRRQLIVVDLETTGTHDDAVPVEVAAVNLDTGKTLHFVPHITQEALSKAEPKAMQVNRYYERGLFEQALSPDKTAEKYRELQEMLSGNVFAGSNPAFDSRILAAVQVVPKIIRSIAPWSFYPTSDVCELADYALPFGRPWHHRLADLAAYAAGKLNIDLDDLPGLDAVVERLLPPDAYDVAERHTAMGDAVLTAACFDLLRNMGTWSSNRYLLSDLSAMRSDLWAGR